MTVRAGLAFALLAFIAGLALGHLGPKRGKGTLRVTQSVEKGDVGPRKLLDHKEPLPGIASRIRQREVLPERVYETSEPTEPNDSHSLGLGGAAEPEARKVNDSRNAVQQVTYRKGLLSVFVHENSLLREYQFRARPSFDAITPGSGPPRVFVDRCWACEPSLFLEAGVVASTEWVAPTSYLALDGSVALLSTRFRIFARPEVNPFGVRFRLGGRLALF